MMMARNILMECLVAVRTLVANTDSAAAKGMCSRLGVGKVRHLEMRWLWVQDQVLEKRLSVGKIPGERNKADLNTKALTAERFWMLLGMISGGARWGSMSAQSRLVASLLCEHLMMPTVMGLEQEEGPGRESTAIMELVSGSRAVVRAAGRFVHGLVRVDWRWLLHVVIYTLAAAMILQWVILGLGPRRTAPSRAIAPSPDSHQYLTGLRVAGLQDELRARGLPVGGIRADLVDRIRDFDVVVGCPEAADLANASRLALSLGEAVPQDVRRNRIVCLRYCRDCEARLAGRGT